MSRTSRRHPRAVRPVAERLEAREVPAVVGGLDPSFGGTGKVTTNFGGTDTAAGVARQPDGKIVVAGRGGVGVDFAVARYNPDGSPDNTFGGDGLVTVNFGFAANDETATALALQDDGKVVVVGFAKIGGDQDFIVARLTPAGDLDTTFSADGKTSFSFGGGGTNNDQAFAVAVQAVGGARKVVVAGSTDQTAGGTGIDFGVVRFNDDGTVDTKFSRTAGGTDVARGVAVDGQNRIVVGGFTDAFGTNDFAVMRFTAAGAFDTTFNGNANQVVNFGFNDQARGLVVQPDDKVVVAGFDDGGAADFAVLRLNADGTVDTAGFNPTGAGALGSAPGRFTFNFGALGVVEQATSVALQPDGRLVLGGFTALGGVVGNPNNFAVARVTADGQLDPSFDGDGRATVDFGADDQAAGVVVDRAGRVVLAGSTAGADFAVARLIGSVEQAHELAAGGSLDGKAAVYTPVTATGLYTAPAGATVAPFGATTRNSRAAVGDVNGDGVEDTILVTGPGTPIRFAVVSGVDNTTLLVPITAPFAGSEDFAGGGYVTAADLDNDGRAEFVFSPDQGGGPRVTIFSLVGTTATVRANFLGITDDPNFRGGARTAAGDVNGDGFADLAVAAGFLGGPRTALFNGATLLTSPTKLVSDFFSFAEDVNTLRNGAYVAAGDVNGDGFAELIFGGGPNGAPRLLVFNGSLVAAGNAVGAYAAPVANFFVAGDANDRGGVRVAAADTDGDNKAEVVAASGANRASRVRAYLGKNFAAAPAGEPATFQDLDPFGGAVLADGVYVG